MSALDDTVKEMKTTIDALLANASELLELSKHVDSVDELTPLQTEQEKLITQLISLDEEVQKRAKTKAARSKLPEWDAIQAGLDKFEELNQAFITQLGIRKGIIQFEINDIKKSKKQLAAMKDSYGATSGKKSSGRRGINTIT